MATVTKTALTDRIAREAGLSRVAVRQIIDRFLAAILDELGNGSRLELRDFAVLDTKVRAARTARNPKTGEPVTVPAGRTVTFRPSRMMKARLRADAPDSTPV